MSPARSILIFIGLVFLGGALLAPWLYHGVQWGAKRFSVLENLSQNPFHRYVNRSLLILAILGLYPLIRSLNLGGWRGLGFIQESWGREWVKGFGCGFISLAIVFSLLIGFGAGEPKSLSSAQLVSIILKALLSALVVGILEEILFRGALFRSLRQTSSFLTAMAWSSAIYAIVHFFRRPESPQVIEWYSGFVILGRMLRGFLDIRELVPAFLNLFLAGAILAKSLEKRGTLLFAIGLHAGWIFWLKLGRSVVQPSSGELSWWWGSDQLIDGWSCSLILLTLYFLIGRVKPSTVAAHA